MVVYAGWLDDPNEPIQFLRREMAGLRALRRLHVTREKTVCGT